jgi:hypothetical protein
VKIEEVERQRQRENKEREIERGRVRENRGKECKVKKCLRYIEKEKRKR